MGAHLLKGSVPVGAALLVILDSASCFLLGGAFNPISLRGQHSQPLVAKQKIGSTVMSIFPSGSGCTGAFTKSEGKVEVEFPYQLDNSDPFVYDTMTIRVPTKIIGRTVEYNKKILPQVNLDAMAAVGAEMRGNAPIRKLSSGPDVDHWNACLAPLLDKKATWNQIPWYVGETYVYHRLLEASGYWDPSSPGHGIDIFAPEKRESLALSLPQVQVRMAVCKEAAGQWTLPYFTALLHMSLWGNQVSSFCGPRNPRV
jgi:hypothetical protein